MDFWNRLNEARIRRDLALEMLESVASKAVSNQEGVVRLHVCYGDYLEASSGFADVLKQFHTFLYKMSSSRQYFCFGKGV